MKGLDGRVLYDWHDGRGGDATPPNPRTLYMGRLPTINALKAGLLSARNEVELRGGTNIRAEFRDSRGELLSTIKVV